jgi:cysteine protease ATG4
MPFEYANIITCSEPVVSLPLIRQEAGDWRTPILLLVPLMLGVANLTPNFFKPVKDFFNMSNCVGIVGGKPDSAYYFVGYQRNKLLYLDPHCVQKVSTDRASFS